MRAGLSAYGEAGLRRDLSAAMPTVRADAHWALARWYAANLRLAEALEHLHPLRSLDPVRAASAHCAVLEADLLLALGRRAEARTAIETAVATHGDTADLCLAMSNALAGSDPDAQLEWLSRPFVRQGLVRLRRRDAGGPFGYDDLAADDPPTIPDGALVTIAVPAWRAAGTLAQTLRSLAAQSWRGLEVIVVDDGSTDETLAVAETFAEADARFVVLRHALNAGCYAARNTALEAASGFYFVVHDADDWSHPQRIERQVAAMADHAAVFAAWTRVSRTMEITQTWKGPGIGLVKRNFSSFMLRTADARALGGWDPVRFAADLDFVERATHAWGAERIAFVLPDVPMSFSLDLPTSLTRNAASHMRTQAYGVRGEYVRASRHWRAVSPPKALLRPIVPDGGRSFPAPATMLARHAPPERFDLVLVSAAGIGQDQERTEHDLVRAAAGAGLRVALFHWPVPGPGARMRAPLRQLAHEGRVTVVAAGEAIRCSLLLLADPSVLAWRPDSLPSFGFDRLAVMIPRLGRLVGDEAQHPPAPVRAVEATFGTAGRWIPASSSIRRRLLALEWPPPSIAAAWQPPIDPSAWPHLAAAPVPAVGLIGQDAGLRLRRYRSWKPAAADEAGTRGLLAGIDVLVARADERPFDSWDRAILEAMASGVPCILPPDFADGYGPAALYARPRDVRAAIVRLRADAPARRALVGRARAFAEGASDVISALFDDLRVGSPSA